MRSIFGRKGGREPPALASAQWTGSPITIFRIDVIVDADGLGALELELVLVDRAPDAAPSR